MSMAERKSDNDNAETRIMPPKRRAAGGIEKKAFIDWFLDSNGATSVAVVILGFLAGVLLLLLIGRNPIGMFRAIGQSVFGKASKSGGWSYRNIGETLAFSIPYVLCGLSMGFAARVGLFNIGAEGQYAMGMLAAHVVAVCIPDFPGQWLLCIIAAILVGSIWGGVVGLLKANFKVSEVVATIMLNYVALYLYPLVSLYLLPQGTVNKTGRTADLAASSLLSKFLIKESNLNIGFFFMIFAVVAYWFIMEKTKLGFSLRATGFNKEAARCSGINDTRAISLSMAISGAFAGLAGACVLLGMVRYSKILTGQDNYGFMGIAVALVGNSRALGIILAGLLFGILKQAYSIMQGMSIPKEVVTVIEGLIVIFIALRSGLSRLKDYRAKQRVRKEASR